MTCCEQQIDETHPTGRVRFVDGMRYLWSVPFILVITLVKAGGSLVWGAVIASKNLEHGVNGGYDTMEGYERFDGQARPSDAQYAILDCLLTSTVSVGDVVTDSTGAIFGTVIALTTP